MKQYTFSNLSVRGFPTLAEMKHPFIYGNVQVIINVSEHQYPKEIQNIIDEKGIRSYFLPLKELVTDMGIDNIIVAVKILMEEDKTGDKMVIHCMFGNNRSRTVAEAFYYKKIGSHLEDEYKGAQNHLIHNCNEGYLPDLRTVEQMINEI